jgi:molybdenum cofactor cytidylyltransferase
LNDQSVGIIILAAGSSSRLGQPKQLLEYEGETLLWRAVRVALETEYRPVIVVLGSQAETLQSGLAATEARIVFNREWEEGMSSSIRCGLRALETMTAGGTEAAILMLCDQPLVGSAVIHRLVETYLSQRALFVASEFETKEGKTRGVPALFCRRLFAELMELRGGAGARRIIARHAAEGSVIQVPEAAFDVDTPDDYLALRGDAPKDTLED